MHVYNYFGVVIHFVTHNTDELIFLTLSEEQVLSKMHSSFTDKTEQFHRVTKC